MLRPGVYSLLLLLTACQPEVLPKVGIKMKGLYAREMRQWGQQNDKTTYEQGPQNYPAYFRSEQGFIKGKVSFRGDLNRHWQGYRQSFRFRTDGEAYYEGMKEFDFIIPEDKAYELEPVGYELGRDLGLLVPRWKAVSFAMNSKALGTYFLLERWTAESMELRGMSEGDVIKEANAWLDVIRVGPKSRYQDVFLNRKQSKTFNPLALRIEIYQGSFNGLYSSVAMERFAGLLSATQSSGWKDFVPEDYAVSWMTLMLTMGAYHGVLGDNVRWYFHPTQRNFRPIPYDFLPEPLHQETCPHEGMALMNPFIQSWMKEASFRSKLKAKLMDFTSEVSLQKRLDEIYGMKPIATLAIDGNGLKRKKLILQNARVIQKSLSSCRW